MTFDEAYEIVGKPTTGNTKMGSDTLCFNTTPFECNTGAKLRKIAGSVCEYCYSCKLCNFRTNVEESYRRNYERLVRALASLGVPKVAEIISEIITKKDRKKIRIKDGGDAVNEHEFDVWLCVAKQHKHRKFWVPTKEYQWIRRFFDRVSRIPRNVIYRVSSPMVDQAPMKEFRYTSVVYTKDKYEAVKDTKSVKKCPAKWQGNQCRKCDHCYNPEVKTVVYPTNRIPVRR